MKGFTKFSNKVLYDNNLQPITKLVYAMLCSYDRGRGCFAKKATLSKMIGCSLYHLRLALNELEAQELIVIHRRKKGMTDLISVVKPVDDGDETISSLTYKKKTKLKVDVLPKNEVKIPKETAEIEADDVFERKDTEKHPVIPLKPPTSIKPNPQHLNTTKQLTKGFREVLRDASYNAFIHNKIAVSYTDDATMLINCCDDFTATWLKENYKSIADRVSGKRCEFVSG